MPQLHIWRINREINIVPCLLMHFNTYFRFCFLFTGHRVLEMGHEILPGLSPAHRRTSSAPSPSPFRRLPSREDPDLGWRSLARRHKFLLTMLGILTFLCTVYLYFAITLGTKDSCSGLGGTQRALCLLASKNGKDILHATHHRQLMFVEDSGMAYSLVVAL